MAKAKKKIVKSTKSAKKTSRCCAENDSPVVDNVSITDGATTVTLEIVLATLNNVALALLTQVSTRMDKIEQGQADLTNLVYGLTQQGSIKIDKQSEGKQSIAAPISGASIVPQSAPKMPDKKVEIADPLSII